MLIVRCERQDSGYPDIYVIKGVSTIDQLKSQIENQISVEAYEPTEYRSWKIIVLESLVKREVFFKNYLNISKSDSYTLMSREYLKKFRENICKSCVLRDSIHCTFKDDFNGGCANKREFNVWKWFKR